MYLLTPLDCGTNFNGLGQAHCDSRPTCLSPYMAKTTETFHQKMFFHLGIYQNCTPGKTKTSDAYLRAGLDTRWAAPEDGTRRNLCPSMLTGSASCPSTMPQAKHKGRSLARRLPFSFSSKEPPTDSPFRAVRQKTDLVSVHPYMAKIVKNFHKKIPAGRG